MSMITVRITIAFNIIVCRKRFKYRKRHLYGNWATMCRHRTMLRMFDNRVEKFRSTFQYRPIEFRSGRNCWIPMLKWDMAMKTTVTILSYLPTNEKRIFGKWNVKGNLVSVRKFLLNVCLIVYLMNSNCLFLPLLMRVNTIRFPFPIYLYGINKLTLSLFCKCFVIVFFFCSIVQHYNEE